MLAELTYSGRLVENVSLVALWFTVLLRAPSAARSHWQRSLWLAIAAAAFAMTLNMPAVQHPLHQLIGSADLVALVRNLTGVVSAAAVLDFVLFTTGNPRLRVRLYGATLLAMAALLALDRTAPPHAEHGIRPAGAPVPSTAYWILLIGIQLTANIACCVVCWRYGRRGENRTLRLCLLLFGGGTACAGLFWLGYLVYLPTRSAGILAVQPMLMGLHGILRAVALAVPALLGLRRKIHDLATVWRLWPLWCDLITVVPHVALLVPRARIREVLRPDGSWNLLAYRKIIEIRDAILVLRDRTPPELLGAAERHVAAATVPADQADAAVLACVLRVIGAVPPADPAPSPTRQTAFFESGGTDLEAETAFLIKVARAYHSALVADFTRSRDAEDRAAESPHGADRIPPEELASQG
ncbi:MAB_1171c family putative transporter [Streptomyces sp. NPDC101165]|uniref:MAB_1171c family putative transporter n=1 Tax=Streptomyces sp. NPDC101165 TaxID=3366119 RepID=UPI003813C9B5